MDNSTSNNSQDKDRITNILKIIRMGHPVLTKKAKEIKDPTSKEVAHIVDDMIATIEDMGDYAGLAAPQVHISLRIVILTPNGEPPLTVMINPTWHHISEEKELGWEGCFSIPDMLGEVPRYRSIKYNYYDLEGKKISKEAHGFHARVVQHECDHLDGILYPQRMKDFSRFGFVKEIVKHRISQ